MNQSAMRCVLVGALVMVGCGCAQTTLSVATDEAGDPKVPSEPLPPASDTLDADFDPVDPNAAPPTGHEHHGHGAMPKPEKEPAPMTEGHQHGATVPAPASPAPMPAGHDHGQPAAKP